MSGQYLGLFFAALLFLWLGSKRVDTDKKPLFCYSIVMAVVVLCPVTAWVLLKYQTAFYTYSHLFLLIPMVLVLAWGMTEGTERALEYLPGSRREQDLQENTANYVKGWHCFFAPCY